jgi:hypothetical protein
LTRLREIGKEKYGWALALILLSMVFMMAAPSGKWADVVALDLQALALFACTRAAQPDMRIRVLVGVVIGLVMVAASVEAGFSATVHESFVRLCTASLVVIATPVIAWGLIRQVRERGMITIHTMTGTLCIYLLMSLAFASCFAAIASVSGEHFFDQGARWDTLNSYLYYSLTTITTVGMGDLSPATNMGRSLTAAEALIGQIYVVTVVAAIVGNIGRKRLQNG